jgi:hypothetical protein
MQGASPTWHALENGRRRSNVPRSGNQFLFSSRGRTLPAVGASLPLLATWRRCCLERAMKPCVWSPMSWVSVSWELWGLTCLAWLVGNYCELTIWTAGSRVLFSGCKVKAGWTLVGAFQETLNHFHLLRKGLQPEKRTLTGSWMPNLSVLIIFVSF